MSTFLQVTTIALTLCGIVLITRPKIIFGSSETVSADVDSINYSVFGPVAAFASTLFGANAYVLLRVSRKYYNHLECSYSSIIWITGAQRLTLLCDYDQLWTVCPSLHICPQLVLWHFVLTSMRLGSPAYHCISSVQFWRSNTAYLSATTWRCRSCCSRQSFRHCLCLYLANHFLSRNSHTLLRFRSAAGHCCCYSIWNEKICNGFTDGVNAKTKVQVFDDWLDTAKIRKYLFSFIYYII